jgi:CMP-N,N'-diacetyllegionaminic acid synthase
MEVKDSRICVILARSGSKRLPQKNLQRINGKTLIEHAVNCCTDNSITTIVSSDSNEILDHIKSKNVILHKRSSLNSDDKASSEQALVEVLKFHDISPNTEVFLIPPTNPLRKAEDLSYFIKQWEVNGKPNGYDQAFSVLSLKNDFWYQNEGKIKRVRDVIFKKVEPRTSFSRMNIFLETSAIYLTYAHLLYAGLSIIESNPYPIELSRLASIDIDSEMDLKIARKLMEE